MATSSAALAVATAAVHPTRPLTNSADDKALLEKEDKSPDSPPVEKPVPAPAPQPVKKSKSKVKAAITNLMAG
jgi:hypothetical protein